MASHLTVISGANATSAGSAAGRAFAGQQAGAQNATTEPGGLLGLFAALLDKAGIAPVATPSTTAPAPETSPTSDPDLSALFRLGLQSNFGGETDDEAANSDALAAVVDAPVQPLVPVDPKPMVNFVEALTALKTSLDRGEPLDAELLSQVENALADLAEALGLKLDELAIPEDFAALLETTGTDETGFAGAMTQLLAPLATSLAAAQPAVDADIVVDTPALNAQLKALGDKLAAMLAALEEGKVPPEKLTAIGMSQGQALDPEIEAALARFAATTAPAPAMVPEEPVLATPALKLTEPVLTGKVAETAAKPDAPEASQPVASPSNPSDLSGDEDQSQSSADRGRERFEPVTRDTRQASTAAAPAATDASNTPAPSADANAQQPVGARVDASANPRIIQAGYQTSQQQLNLPQIAFELARQVQDGNTRFQIRLDPPELGRIDVRLDIDQSGKVNARLVVEKAETLDLMQRDQRGLERALQQAGLDSAKTNLEFSLKQNPFAGQLGQFGEGKSEGGQNGGLSANDNGAAAGEAEEAPPMVNLYRGALQASGVNIIA